MPNVKAGIVRVVDVFAMIGVVAGIMMFVRPGSKGPAFVAAVGDAWIAAASGTIGARLDGTQPAPPRPKGSTPKGKSGGSGDGGITLPLFPTLPPPFNLPFKVPDPFSWVPDLNPFD